MYKKIKVNKKLLENTIKLLNTTSSKNSSLYDLGIDIYNFTEDYQKLIDDQLEVIWGKDNAEWIRYYLYESTAGGYCNEKKCGICYDIDSMWTYFRGGNYKAKYEKDCKFFLFSIYGKFHLIECVSEEIFKKIFVNLCKNVVEEIFGLCDDNSGEIYVYVYDSLDLCLAENTKENITYIDLGDYYKLEGILVNPNDTKHSKITYQFHYKNNNS